MGTKTEQKKNIAITQASILEAAALETRKFLKDPQNKDVLPRKLKTKNPAEVTPENIKAVGHKPHIVFARYITMYAMTKLLRKDLSNQGSIIYFLHGASENEPNKKKILPHAIRKIQKKLEQGHVPTWSIIEGIAEHLNVPDTQRKKLFPQNVIVTRGNFEPLDKNKLSLALHNEWVVNTSPKTRQTLYKAFGFESPKTRPHETDITDIFTDYILSSSNISTSRTNYFFNKISGLIKDDPSISNIFKNALRRINAPEDHIAHILNADHS